MHYFFRKQKKIIITLSLILSLILSGCSLMRRGWNDHEETPVTVVFSDVGKGDCIVIRAGEHVTMIDTGYDETVNTVMQDLKTLGIDHIDEMIITHYDKDHCGGAETFLEAYPVGSVYLPDYSKNGSSMYVRLQADLEKSGSTVIRVDREETFTADVVTETGPQTATFKILPSLVSYDETEENDNDMSLVTELLYGDDSYIFLGDLEKPSIEAYLARNEGTYDIMKFPHHGDWKKNIDDLIRQINPKIVIVTDGEDRPIEEKSEHYLQSAGIDHYTSLQNGTIAVYSTGEGTYDVQTAR